MFLQRLPRLKGFFVSQLKYVAMLEPVSPEEKLVKASE
jgi:hypothetical protein